MKENVFAAFGDDFFICFKRCFYALIHCRRKHWFIFNWVDVNDCEWPALKWYNALSLSPLGYIPINYLNYPTNLSLSDSCAHIRSGICWRFFWKDTHMQDATSSLGQLHQRSTTCFFLSKFSNRFFCKHFIWNHLKFGISIDMFQTKRCNSCTFPSKKEWTMCSWSNIDDLQVKAYLIRLSKIAIIFSWILMSDEFVMITDKWTNDDYIGSSVIIVWCWFR